MVQQDNVWQAVLGEIEVTLSRGTFMTYFKNTVLLKHEDGVITIGVINPFIMQHLEKKFGGLIIDTLRKQNVDVQKVEYKRAPASSQRR